MSGRISHMQHATEVPSGIQTKYSVRPSSSLSRPHSMTGLNRAAHLQNQRHAHALIHRLYFCRYVDLQLNFAPQRRRPFSKARQ